MRLLPHTVRIRIGFEHLTRIRKSGKGRGPSQTERIVFIVEPYIIRLLQVRNITLYFPYIEMVANLTFDKVWQHLGKVVTVMVVLLKSQSRGITTAIVPFVMDMVYGFVMVLKRMGILLQTGVETNYQSQNKSQKCMKQFFEHTDRSAKLH